MLEALLSEGGILKRVLDSIKELVSDANFDCSSTGIALQAMDSSHVSLVSLLLRADGFEQYRCDRTVSLGINLASLGKILKCAGNDDAITIKSDEGQDTVSFLFESAKQTRISHFTLKLIDIDSEHLGIPETVYKTVIKMPSSQFQRICKELATIGDTVAINATKEGVKFSVAGDAGSGSIVCKQGGGSDDKEEDQVHIKLDDNTDVNLTFALRYLNFFARATPLSNYVTLKMSPEVPLVVEYTICTDQGGENSKEMGYIRFYLAPKIEDENEEKAAEEKQQEASAPAPGVKKEKVKGEEAETAED